jgi:hypothetical protein
MTNQNKRVILISGASSGIGYPLDLLAAGVKKTIPQPLFQWVLRDHYKIN